MAHTPIDHSEAKRSYLEFVVRRAQSANFRAEEKLRRIDEIAELVFTARKNLSGSRAAKK